MTYDIISDCHSHTPRINAIASGTVERVQCWISENVPGLFSVGIHPWHTAVMDSTQTDLVYEEIKRLTSDRRVVAVGEAGIDKLRGASREVQIEILRRQIMISESVGVPLVLHVVKSVDDIMLLRKSLCAQQPWIWHGFRGKPEQATQWLASDDNFYISFGERFNLESALIVPANRILVETDESALSVYEIARRLDDACSLPAGSTISSARENLKRIFCL